VETAELKEFFRETICTIMRRGKSQAYLKTKDHKGRTRWEPADNYHPFMSECDRPHFR